VTTSLRSRHPRPSSGPTASRRGHTLWALALGTVLVTLVAWLDSATGPALSVEALNVLVVVGVTWMGSRRHATLIAVLAATEDLAVTALVAEPAMVTPASLWNAATSLGVLVLVVVLLDSLHRSLEHQRRLAAMDALTGVLNRRAFEIAAERERLRAARHGTPLSVAFLDLDHFKTANDRLGHRVGDRLLAAVAEAVTNTVRGTDLFARLGGDEFVLLLPETDAREAMTVVQRVRAAAAAAGRAQGHPTAMSAGIATFRFPPESVDAMLAAADHLMYQAKEAGRDRVVGAVVAGPWPRWAAASLEPDVRALSPAERG
jgi:diguanylate cyclase (GGDEF)-like protein